MNGIFPFFVRFCVPSSSVPTYEEACDEWKNVKNLCAMAFLIEISTNTFVNYWSFNLVLESKARTKIPAFHHLPRRRNKENQESEGFPELLNISLTSYISCITLECERNKSSRSDTLIMDFSRKCRTRMEMILSHRHHPTRKKGFPSTTVIDGSWEFFSPFSEK